MRVTLELDGVQVRGADALRQPLVWPVWFAVDGDTVRALLGDVTATVPVHAPGPQVGSAPLAWARTLVPSGLPESATGVGLAMLYTEGGATDLTARAQYADLTDRVRLMALDAAAEASGLAPLFGRRGNSLGAGVALASLTEGVELEASGGAESSPSDVDAAFLHDPAAHAAFTHVASLLARLAPGAPVQHTDLTRPTIVAPMAEVPPPSAPPRPTVPGLVTLPGVLRDGVLRSGVVAERVLSSNVVRPPVRTAATPTLAEGTVAASFVQFWPTSVVAARDVADIRRTLPTRTALRDSLRAALTLSGRVRREG